MAGKQRIIGLKKGTVKLVEHNEQWHAIAQNTIDELKSILGDMADDIEHIGSTSICNIYAKPIIDIVIGLKKLNDILDENVINILGKHGYLRDREHDNESKIFFYKGQGDIITHHMHAVVYGEYAWNCYTKLRDHLNENYDIACRYQDLKLESMRNCDDDISKYHEGKAELLKEINRIIRLNSQRK